MLLFAALLSAAPVIAPSEPLKSAPSIKCPRAMRNYTYWNGGRLGPRKLTELPPATAYMAVVRHIGTCDAPLTMIDYRNPGRR
jgi:hypothetical protein